ncbi:MAG: helix-turn-helix transcriptional regulator [Agathobacter sp.]|nr:helix-turn-helix transcriptional regulator [Agathobacter sp.]
MGKKSIKENKNIYQLCREELDLTRDKASEMMQFISSDRIEKIENEKSLPHPDEILLMAECYKKPNLCNYYCSHECPIGHENVPELKLKDLSQIVLEMLASLNSMDKEKNRLIEITADGEITEDEYRDFASIQKELNKISLSVNSLKLWLDQMVADGKIDKELLEKASLIE